MRHKNSSKVLPVSDEVENLPLTEKYTQKLESMDEDWSRLLTYANATSKWLHFTSTRRSYSHKLPISTVSIGNVREQFYDNLNSALNGIDSEIEDSDVDNVDEEGYANSTSHRSLPKSSSKALIVYFAKLAQSTNSEDELDLDFIFSLIENGADVNLADKYGQTVFHEVARTWHVDVGKFLLAHGANLNISDKYGRTPLHVAAAVNYPDMVKFLIENGAKVKAKTFGEGQTAVHYAAKNDALGALKVLTKFKCDLELQDYKKRTPIHVAAELDRSETALFLVEEGVRVGNCDSSGLSTLTLMIDKMPPVAYTALDQFHRTDRANRKQYFYLNLLEPVKPGKFSDFTRSPMQSVTINKQMNLLLHPAFRELIKVKWCYFARMAHLRNTFFQIIFVLVWSAFALTAPLNATSEYSLATIKSIWYRAVLEIIGLLWTLVYIGEELYEWRDSSNDHRRWQSWRRIELNTDLKYCHPRWPEEQKYILKELEGVKAEKISYFSDYWNYLDWTTFGIIMVGVAARIPALLGDSVADKAHKRLLTISILIIWFRLFKYARPFTTLGPFIVMMGNILAATFKFMFLYFGVIIPYVIAFWINFGGEEHAKLIKAKGQSPDGWKEPQDLMYSTWLMTVVGDFDFNAISALDPIFAQFLVGTYTAISAILLLNLYIALLSDTFQRVHDNVVANALMQKAIAINSYQNSMRSSRRNRFLTFIQNECAPEKIYYDDDDKEDGGELEKMTIQIKEVVDGIQDTLDNKFEDDRSTVALESMRNEIQQVVQRHKESINLLNNKLDHLTNLVQYIIEKDKQGKQERHEKPESIASTVDSKKNDFLPSIYQLKPQLFSMTLEERLDKTIEKRSASRGPPSI